MGKKHQDAGKEESNALAKVTIEHALEVYLLSSWNFFSFYRVSVFS